MQARRKKEETSLSRMKRPQKRSTSRPEVGRRPKVRIASWEPRTGQATKVPFRLQNFIIFGTVFICI
jgi:hypothetical protein